MFSYERLKARRLAMGLSLEEVGEVVGVSRSAVQKYEKNVIKNVYANTVELFAKALHCSPAYLMCWTDNPLEGMQQVGERVAVQDNEAEILQAWRGATDSARESVLTMLCCSKEWEFMKDKLIQLLNDRNMRPAQLAQAAGISTSTVDDIVKGKVNALNIGVDKMLRIANVLGVSVEYLYGRSEPPGFSQPPDHDEAQLLDFFQMLNEEGKEKAISYLEDLVDTGKYKKT